MDNGNMAIVSKLFGVIGTELAIKGYATVKVNDVEIICMRNCIEEKALYYDKPLSDLMQGKKDE